MEMSESGKWILETDVALIKIRRDASSLQGMMRVGKNKFSQVRDRRAADQLPYCKRRQGNLVRAKF